MDWLGRQAILAKEKRKYDQSHAIVPMYFLRKLLGNQKVLQKKSCFLKASIYCSVRAVEGGPGGPWPPQYLALPRLEISANTKKEASISK